MPAAEKGMNSPQHPSAESMPEANRRSVATSQFAVLAIGGEQRRHSAIQLAVTGDLSRGPELAVAPRNSQERADSRVLPHCPRSCSLYFRAARNSLS